MVLSHQWVAPADESNPDSAPVETSVVATSDPRPVVDLTDWYVSSADEYGVTISLSGTVKDAIADNARRNMGADIASVMVEVDGQVVATLPVTGGSDGAATRWRQHPYKGTFSGSATAQVGPGRHVLRLVSSENAVGNTGVVVADLVVERRQIGVVGGGDGGGGGGTTQALAAIVHFPSGEVDADVSACTLTLMEGSTGTLTRSVDHPEVYTGTLTTLNAAQITARLETAPVVGLTASPDAFAGALRLIWTDSGAQAAFTAAFTEDAALSGNFKGMVTVPTSGSGGGGGGGAVQTVTTASITVTSKSDPGSYHPVTFRVKPMAGKGPDDYEVTIDGDSTAKLQAAGADGWCVVEGGSDLVAVVFVTTENGVKVTKLMWFSKNGKIVTPQQDKRIAGYAKLIGQTISAEQTVQIAKVADIVGQPLVCGDTNRDGSYNDADLAGRAASVVFSNENGTEGVGAVILLNAKADGSHVADDLTAIRLRPVGDIPDAFRQVVRGRTEVSVKIQIAAPAGADAEDTAMAAKAMKVYLAPGDAAPLFGPDLVAKELLYTRDRNGAWKGPPGMPQDPAQWLTLYAEGREPGVHVDLRVDATIKRFWQNDELFDTTKINDVCNLMTSPIIGITPLVASDALLYGTGNSENPVDRENWLRDVRALSAGIADDHRVLTGANIGFPQDHGQLAYTAVKATGSIAARRAKPIVLRFNVLPIEDLTRLGVDVYPVPYLSSLRQDKLAQGGNFECLPTPGSPMKPLTWIRIGVGEGKTDCDRLFFERRCVPRTMKIIDKSVLPFFHVDEVLAVVPASDGFKLCIPDLDKAIELIQNPAVTFEKSGSVAEARTTFSDPANKDYIDSIRKRLAEITAQLTGLGYRKEDVVPLPVLIQWRPNGINMQSLSGAVAVPDPFCAPFRSFIQTALQSAGVPLFSKPFLDTWGPNQQGGNVHCATLPLVTRLPENLP